MASSLIIDSPAACSSSSLAARTTIVSNVAVGTASWSVAPCTATSSPSAAKAVLLRIEVTAILSKSLPVTTR